MISSDRNVKCGVFGCSGIIVYVFCLVVQVWVLYGHVFAAIFFCCVDLCKNDAFVVFVDRFVCNVLRFCVD